MSAESDYLLGVSDTELERLGFQHQVWAEATQALFNRAGFASGHRLVDLGAGPGFATFDLARRVGAAGHVLGVDGSDKSIYSLTSRAAALGLDNVAGEVADVTRWSAPEPVDGIFARWLFCFLRDPGALVERAATWLAPGGALVVLDYFNYRSFAIAPRSAAFDVVVRAAEKSWSDSGGSLDVGGAIPTMMAKAGLVVESVTPTVYCARPGSPVWGWPRTFFASYLAVLVGKGLLTEGEAEAFESVYADRERNPEAYVLTPPVIGIVGRKPS